MVSTSIIINKYAEAAFNIAKKENAVDQFLANLKLFSDSFSSAISKELSNPTISKADLINVVNEVATKLSIDQKTVLFLQTIAQARRIGLIKPIYNAFLKLSKLDKNIIEVELIVAEELNNEQIEKIKSLLQKKYSNNILEIKQTIKKNLLGGIMIKIGSIIIDATVKNQLAAIMKECKLTINQ